MSKVSENLLQLMDRFRKNEFDLRKFIQAAIKSNITVDYSDLRELSRSYPEITPHLISEEISDFISSLLQDFQPKRIFAPWVKDGSLLSALVKNLRPKEGALGKFWEQADGEVLKYLTSNQNITWRYIPEDDLLQKNPNEKYEINFFFSVYPTLIAMDSGRELFIDFFVFTPHFEPKVEWLFGDNGLFSRETDDDWYRQNLIELHDEYKDYDHNVSSLMSDLFSYAPSSVDQQIGIFTVSPYFFDEIIEEDDEKKEELEFWQKERREELDKNDYYIDAAFQLPYEIFKFNVPTSLYLILIRTGKSNRNNQKMFVGQLSGDKKQNSILLKNYHERKPGRIPQQGMLVEESDFKGLDLLVLDYEIKQLAARAGLEPYPINKIAKKITPLIKQRVNNSFSNSHNCIYVPLKGDHPIVLTETDFSLAPSEYVQVVLKSERIFSLRHFTEDEFITKYLKNMRWDLLQSSEITLPFIFDSEIVEFNFQQRGIYDLFSEENCIYLPIRGTSPVVTSSDEFILHQGEYLQIVCDSQKVFAPYLAHLLNSQLGLQIRKSLTVGLKIPEITKDSLEAGTIYLPDVETQRETMLINSNIVNLSSELGLMQKRLLEFPQDRKTIEDKLKAFSPEKGRDLWMEDLPFPMASILWAYFSTVEPKDKLEHISHFFEASVQFFATICLSAVAQDREYYRANQREWIADDSKYKGWYKNASFGSWYSLHASLSKFIRRLVMQPDTKSQCLNLFGKPNDQFVYGITSKKLLSVFETANKYRNLWIGHRGRLSEGEAEKRVLAFENLLSQMREIIGDIFSQVTLVSPKTSEYMDGLFEYKVKSLKGTRHEFKELIVKTKSPMDKSKLYLLSDLQYTPMEILPFGKLMSSPKTEQNAFYFYSRFDNNGVRWVSYHFEKEAEVHQHDPEVIGLMKELFD